MTVKIIRFVKEVGAVNSFFMAENVGIFISFHNIFDLFLLNHMFDDVLESYCFLAWKQHCFV